VTARKIGDRVGVPWVQTSCGRCEWCRRGKPMFCADSLGTSMQLPGGHAEYMLAYADATMLLPDGLSFEQAAPIFCAGYTVWSGFRWAAPQPGDPSDSLAGNVWSLSVPSPARSVGPPFCSPMIEGDHEMSWALHEISWMQR